jgi:hypothetical protein
MTKATRQYIVGREEEVQLLGNVVHGALPYSVVNIYGPGGIGKTVVCQKFQEWCTEAKIPYATVTGEDPTASTIDKMLYRFRKGLEENVTGIVPGRAFDDFDKRLNEYLEVKKVIADRGGIAKMYDLAGNLIDHALLKTILKTVKGTYESIKGYFAHRDALERYIGGADLWLTNSFIEGVKGIVEDGRARVVLLVDTYEFMAGWDDWMCETFVKTLPYDAKVVILGRDRLSKISFDWSQYDETDLHYHELQELSEEEAKAYLRHHRLQDEDSLARVYKFTGGYPLCLVLAVELARELGGWEGVRDFEDPANRDRVAQQLLDRILRQEKVKEVQEFLEKGVVARWFDPGAVSYILEVSPERGREIYDKIGKFSFVQRHPNGLQFHDRVRELLVERLKFMNGGKTYTRLAERWSEYLRGKAGV